MVGAQSKGRPAALVTGGSRGVGAATALALAARGYDIVLTYRNKTKRAGDVAAEVARLGARALPICCDITRPDDVARLFAAVLEWSGHLNALVLNASGGLERDLLAADPEYAMHINRDAQVAVLESALPLMRTRSAVVFVTSHWAHLYGQVAQWPAYAPVAETKHAGELALRARQDGLAERGIRLIVVTGDLVEGTITPKLLARKSRDAGEQWHVEDSKLPTTTDMGEAIARAATDVTLPTGHTIAVGRPLESLYVRAGRFVQTHG